MMGGIVGRLFREFAVTLSTAIVVSMVISLTTTPMMCAHLLKAHDDEKHGRLYRGQRKILRRDAVVLPALADSGCWTIQCLTLMVLLADDRAERGADRQYSQGLFPAAGHRRDRGGVQGRRMLRSQ